MSHTTQLDGVRITDVNAVRQAVEELRGKGVNVTLLQNAAPRMYFTEQSHPCDYVLKLDDRFDVGLRRQPDGSFTPEFDEWNGIVGRTLGAACPMPGTAQARAQHQIGQFAQAYAKHAAINAATARGMYVESSTVDKDGNVQLVLAG